MGEALIYLVLINGAIVIIFTIIHFITIVRNYYRQWKKFRDEAKVKPIRQATRDASNFERTSHEIEINNTIKENTNEENIIQDLVTPRLFIQSDGNTI